MNWLHRLDVYPFLPPLKLWMSLQLLRLITLLTGPRLGIILGFGFILGDTFLLFNFHFKLVKKLKCLVIEKIPLRWGFGVFVFRGIWVCPVVSLQETGK